MYAMLFAAGWYGLFSLVCFAAYAADKTAARHGRVRIPERILHLLSLAGGWPGAIAAQSVLRHKSRKRAFRTIFRLTVVLNGAMLAAAIAIGSLHL